MSPGVRDGDAYADEVQDLNDVVGACSLLWGAFRVQRSGRWEKFILPVALFGIMGYSRLIFDIRKRRKEAYVTGMAGSALLLVAMSYRFHILRVGSAGLGCLLALVVGAANGIGYAQVMLPEGHDGNVYADKLKKLNYAASAGSLLWGGVRVQRSGSLAKLIIPAAFSVIMGRSGWLFNQPELQNEACITGVQGSALLLVAMGYRFHVMRNWPAGLGCFFALGVGAANAVGFALGVKGHYIPVAHSDSGHSRSRGRLRFRR